MNFDDATFEDALSQRTPTRFDERLLGRLTLTLDHASAPVHVADAGMLATLETHRPAGLPVALMERLAGLGDTQEKIVEMPVARDRIVPFRRYAAAAVIALAGAAAALFAPMGGEPPATANVGSPRPAISTVDAREFVPASYARGLSDARDEGVVWKDNTPHQVLRIVYTDTITLRNEAGEIVEVEQPRVEYIMVPKRID